MTLTRLDRSIGTLSLSIEPWVFFRLAIVEFVSVGTNPKGLSYSARALSLITPFAESSPAAPGHREAFDTIGPMLLPKREGFAFVRAFAKAHGPGQEAQATKH